MKRRKAILVVSGISASVTGCISNSFGRPDDESSPDANGSADDDGGRDEWYIRPENDPDTRPSALECNREDTTRYGQQFHESDVYWGDDPDGKLELRIDSVEYSRGDEASIRLRNRGDEPIGRGTKTHYNFQVLTKAGWQDVRVFEGETGPVRSAKEEALLPSKPLYWRIPLQEDEISGDVCPGLPTGRYRFVFYSFSDFDGALAVGFDLTD